MTKLWRGSETIAVDANEPSGGLAIVWNPREIFLHNFYATRYSLSTSFHLLGTTIQGFLLNVYGPQVPDKKLDLLSYMEWFMQ